jgi:hypothetical protein
LIQAPRYSFILDDVAPPRAWMMCDQKGLSLTCSFPDGNKSTRN